ncbi:MAG: YabP/YqfC family sporulation protein [Clostridia bacterium]|nr:YabP/YqfC family sporulation protein [Clostridia bacterium]
MNENSAKTVLVVNERKSVKMNGVKNVIGFDEGYVTLDTSLGRVSIEGRELKIESLTKENGEIYITGNVSGVYYSDPKESTTIFKKMFK